MSTAAEHLRKLLRTQPEVVRLAEAVCLAVAADPALLRAARLRFLPHCDAGVEADLWFSPLVRSRTPDGIVFLPEAAEALRQRLAENRDRVDEAWVLTRELHRHLSPAVRLEEEIAWRVARGDPLAEIEELLRSALAAMVAGDRGGLAHWAARAIPALPAAARATQTVRMLQAGAQLRLTRDPEHAGVTDDDIIPDWLPWVAPTNLPTVPVQIRLLADAVEFDTVETSRGDILPLPATNPLLVEVSWEDEAAPGEFHARPVTFRRGEVVRLPVPTRDVSLRTILGEVYELRDRELPARSVRHDILDFEAEREQHRPFFEEGREHVLAAVEREIDQAFKYDHGRVLALWDADGRGKTALLAHLIDQLASRNVITLQHFFHRGHPKLGDVRLAERSLAAQLAAGDQSAGAVALHELSLHDALQRVPQSRRAVVMVIDAIEDAHGLDGEPGDALAALLPDPVPAGLLVVISIRQQAPTGWSHRLPGPTAHVRLDGSPPPLRAYFEFHAKDLRLEPSWIDEAVHASYQSLVRAEAILGLIHAYGMNLIASVMRQGYVEPSTAFSRWLDQAWELVGIANDPPGVLAAAQGPVPNGDAEELLHRVFDDFPRAARALCVIRDSPEQRTIELRNRAVRGYVIERLGPDRMREHHRQLAQATTAWLFEDVLPDDRPRYDYGLRFGVAHWLAAGDLERAHQLCTRAAVLERKCRDLGVDEARRDLERLISAMRGRGDANVAAE